MTRQVGGILTGLLVLLGGCVTNEEIDLLRNDLRRVKREVYVIVKRSGKESGALRSAVSAVTPIKKQLISIQEELKSVRETQADYETRLEQIRREASKATGTAEEREFKTRQHAQKLRDLKAILETRLAVLEKEMASLKKNRKPTATQPRTLARVPGPASTTKPVPVSPISPSTAVLPTPTVSVPPPAISDDKREHMVGVALLKSGEIQKARAKFKDVLRRFPTSRFSDDAQYWIGETYYREKRYDKAILEYDKVVINYSKGNKVPAALLKQGFAFLALGDKASAKQLMNQLIKEYPKSEEAKTARSRLSSL